MRTDSLSGRIPLPFATSAIGLILSYVLPAKIGAIEGTTIGFAFGILSLYLAGRFELKRTEQESSHRVKCPNCDIDLYVAVRKDLQSSAEVSHLSRPDYSKEIRKENT